MISCQKDAQAILEDSCFENNELSPKIAYIRNEFQEKYNEDGVTRSLEDNSKILFKDLYPQWN